MDATNTPARSRLHSGHMRAVAAWRAAHQQTPRMCLAWLHSVRRDEYDTTRASNNERVPRTPRNMYSASSAATPGVVTLVYACIPISDTEPYSCSSAASRMTRFVMGRLESNAISLPSLQCAQCVSAPGDRERQRGKVRTEWWSPWRRHALSCA